MSELLDPLGQPMTAIERQHKHIMTEELWRMKTQPMIDYYERFRMMLQNYVLEGDDLQQATDIINVLYCELIERGVAFSYSDTLDEN